MSNRDYLHQYDPNHFRFVRQSCPRLQRGDFAGHRPAWQGYVLGLVLALLVIAIAGALA